MNKEDIFAKVKTILIEHTQYSEPDKVTMDSKLKEDINVDSLDTFEIIYDIENEFQIKVVDEDATGFTTIGDIVDYIASKLDEKTSV